MIPSRRLVMLYVMTAHVSLALAFVLTAWNPHAIAGFFYHSRMVAIVHLITIGWIAMSILGNVYVVLPMTFKLAFPAHKADYAAFALVVIGLIGMVSHFWIAEFGGMAWSAATAALGVAYVAARLAVRVRDAKVAAGVKLHIYFASANILAAITLGVLLGFDKVHQFLPGYVLSNVFGHAHLAAVGWASMMVVGIGYHLLPMALPAATPLARTIYISAVLLETGIIGLFCALVMRSDLMLLFAIGIVAGFAAFGAHVLWMLERPRRLPHSRRQPDVAFVHIGAAGMWLLFACVCGLTLTALPVSDSTLRVALLYGTLGLVGFLAQIVVAFELRVLPIAAAYWGIKREPIPFARALSSVLWLAGVPGVGAGLFLNLPALLGTGAWVLLTATVLGGADTALLLMPLRGRVARPASGIVPDPRGPRAMFPPKIHRF